MSFPFQITLTFSNDWEAVELMRTSVSGCLGAVYPNAQSVFAVWVNTPEFHLNMVDANVTQIGIGMAFVPGGSYSYLWTVEFSNGNDGPPGC